jgi:hypothetical protein
MSLMKLRVTFDVEIADSKIDEIYYEGMLAELKASPAEELCRVLAWDLVVGKNGHGVEPDSREMKVQIVREKP